MQEISQISEFGKILIFLIVGIIAVGFVFFLNRILAPNNPTTEKLTSYECGEEPTGNAWIPFNSRFYIIALIFLLFEVEMIFVFPWATVFGNHDIIALDNRWGWFSLVEMFIFLGILILGLVYVWVKGDLDWIKPKPAAPVTDVNIPQQLYNNINIDTENFKVKVFSLESDPAPDSTSQTVASAPSKKPMFRPTFKKP